MSRIPCLLSELPDIDRIRSNLSDIDETSSKDKLNQYHKIYVDKIKTTGEVLEYEKHILELNNWLLNNRLFGTISIAGKDISLSKDDLTKEIQLRRKIVDQLSEIYYLHMCMVNMCEHFLKEDKNETNNK